MSVAAETLVMMFPGQSSRYPEMIDKVTSVLPEAARVVDRASQVLGRDLARHYRRDHQAPFACNRDVQVGVFLANHLHLVALAHRGVHTAWSLGLSLGEYNHLVHIGALSFEAALVLVDARGRLYDQGPVGVMVAVCPISAEQVEHAIEAAGCGEAVAVALYNAPGQHVLAGEEPAVAAVLAVLERDAFFAATVIEPRIPMHSPTFAPVAAAFGAVVAGVPFATPSHPWVPNVRGEVVDPAAATPEAIRSALVAHVHRPVRWQASVDAVAARLRTPRFLEVGPKAVLARMFDRRWSPGRCWSSDAAGPWPDHLHTVIRELSHVA